MSHALANRPDTQHCQEAQPPLPFVRAYSSNAAKISPLIRLDRIPAGANFTTLPLMISAFVRGN